MEELMGELLAWCRRRVVESCMYSTGRWEVESGIMQIFVRVGANCAFLK
jgi:hypothetical protein